MGDGAEAAGASGSRGGGENERWRGSGAGECAACAGGLARRRVSDQGRMVKTGVAEKVMARRRGLYMASSWATGMV